MRPGLKKTFHFISAAAVLTAAALLLSSCSLEISWLVTERKALMLGKQMLSEKEMRVIAMEYKSQFDSYYSELLSESYYQMEVEEGYTFEEYVKDHYILEEAEALLYLTGLASERSVKLTTVEKEDVEKRAASYMAELSEDEIKFLNGADASTVASVLTYYELASKVIDSFLKEQKIDVSEEESRVVDLQVIRVSNADEAAEIHERIVNGENFRTVAGSVSLDAKVEYAVSRESLVPEISSVVFSLDASEVSDVIEYEGYFYVFRVLNGYNVLLSSNNKKNLLAVRKYRNWATDFENYLRDNQPRLSPSFWDALHLDVEGSFTYHGLFSQP